MDDGERPENWGNGSYDDSASKQPEASSIAWVSGEVPKHTAHRIYRRIVEECLGYLVSEKTVRRYVRAKKQELGLTGRETFVPQYYGWGSEAQVDW